MWFEIVLAPCVADHFASRLTEKRINPLSHHRRPEAPSLNSLW